MKNGKTYYYAVCSYTKGDTAYSNIQGVVTGLQPTECSKIIRQDAAGTITFVDVNCAVVTPDAPVAGYQPPQIVGDLSRVTSGLGTGSINASVLNPETITNGVQYTIKFNSKGTIPQYRTTTYDVVRAVNGVSDTLQKNVDATIFGSKVSSLPFDGIVFSFNNDTTVSVNYSLTGWYVGQSNLFLVVVPDNTSSSLDVKWPTDYQMEFYDHTVATTPYNKIPVNYIITD